jgi:hypothetical protein
LWKRSEKRQENVEDGWQTRQKRQAHPAHHRTLRVLWKDIQASLGQEENLNNASQPFFIFFLSRKSATAEKVCFGDAFVYRNGVREFSESTEELKPTN